MQADRAPFHPTSSPASTHPTLLASGGTSILSKVPEDPKTWYANPLKAPMLTLYLPKQQTNFRQFKNYWIYYNNLMFVHNSNCKNNPYWLLAFLVVVQCVPTVSNKNWKFPKQTRKPPESSPAVSGATFQVEAFSWALSLLDNYFCQSSDRCSFHAFIGLLKSSYWRKLIQ